MQPIEGSTEEVVSAGHQQASAGKVPRRPGFSRAPVMAAVWGACRYGAAWTHAAWSVSRFPPSSGAANPVEEGRSRAAANRRWRPHAHHQSDDEIFSGVGRGPRHWTACGGWPRPASARRAGPSHRRKTVFPFSRICPNTASASSDRRGKRCDPRRMPVGARGVDLEAGRRSGGGARRRSCGARR